MVIYRLGKPMVLDEVANFLDRAYWSSTAFGSLNDQKYSRVTLGCIEPCPSLYFCSPRTTRGFAWFVVEKGF